MSPFLMAMVIKTEPSQVLWLTPVIPATQDAEIRKISVQGQPRQKARPYLKNTQHKKGLAQVLEHLPNKCEALSSNSSTTNL
jgi:hypothetical protein